MLKLASDAGAGFSRQVQTLRLGLRHLLVPVVIGLQSEK